MRLTRAWKALRSLAVGFALAGCAAGPAVDTSYRASAQDSRVQFLVLHFTSEDFSPSLRVLTEGPVSAHYLVDRDPPRIYRLVDESRRAYHAGDSSWQGHSQLNAASIGIEIVNRGFDEATGTWQEYPKAQVDLLLELVEDIVRRHEIAPDRIVGHSDVAPQRKIDPGPRFPWKRLADAKLIRWPDADEVGRRQRAFEQSLPPIDWFQRTLARHGYAVPASGELDAGTRRVIAAFQMRYRPSRFDGVPDAETAALLAVLVNP
jgi:N-acetylmuramoyl-L-alanine amidase